MRRQVMTVRLAIWGAAGDGFCCALGVAGRTPQFEVAGLGTLAVTSFGGHGGRQNFRMNPNEVLRIVDAIHRDKNIDPEIVFQAIESALVTAAKKHYGEESEIAIQIDREDGSISGQCNGEFLDPEETVGRIGAQTAKQVIIQRIREAERDALYDEYIELLGQMVSGVVQRGESGATTVSLGNVEAILPRGEQIPGETHHANERVRATVFDVKKQGSRVKVILSRTRPQLVQRLFEQEIPEISEGVITIEALAREPGYRSKVAVASSDPRIDCVGACVGVRGNRIKNIVDELSGERIDIVRYSDDMQVMIPNSLQPAEVDEVILCRMMGARSCWFMRTSSPWQLVGGAKTFVWAVSCANGTSRS